MFPGKFKEATTHIKNLEQLIQDKLNVKVVRHTAEPLTKLGENFGSEILKVDITVEENGEEKDIHAVAKLIPPTTMQMEIFNTQVTFKNEIGFYAEIVEAIKDFQRKHGVEPTTAFADLYGARINLEPGSSKVDNDGIIVLQNLKVEGFDIIDRLQRFDLNGAKQVLTALADFQATALALKVKEPEIFNSKIMPYLVEFHPGGEGIPINLGTLLEDNPATAHLAAKVKQQVVKKKHVKKIREVWATITHNDMWVNNIMVQKNRDGDIQNVKLVDFQIHDLGSPACDLLYFLFSSVQEAVLRFHFDRLIQFYYKEFVNTLSKFKINLEQYTFDSFKEEVKAEAYKEMHHVMYMLLVVLGPKEGLPPLPGKVSRWPPNKENKDTPMTNGSAKKDGKMRPQHDMYTLKFPPGYKEMIRCIVELAEKQKWL